MQAERQWPQMEPVACRTLRFTRAAAELVEPL